MPANAVIRARIEEKVKRKASSVLKAVGLTPSDAFRMMMIRIAREGASPFDPLIPNKETIAAIREAEKGGLPSFNSVEELMADLHADD